MPTTCELPGDVVFSDLLSEAPPLPETAPDGTPWYSYRQRHSPMAPPDWRWRRATQLFETQATADPKLDDRPTLVALQYLRLRPCLTDAELSEWSPELMKAVDLSRDEQRRLEAEARLLAGQSGQEFAERVGSTAAAIDRFALLFFDVRDRLHATTYIQRHAIESRRRSPTTASVVRQAAYYGGPHVLESLLEYLREHGTDHDQVSSVVDLSTPEGRMHLRISILFRALMTDFDEMKAQAIFRWADSGQFFQSQFSVPEPPIPGRLLDELPPQMRVRAAELLSSWSGDAAEQGSGKVEQRAQGLDQDDAA